MKRTLSLWNGVAAVLFLVSACCSPLIAPHKGAWTSASQFLLGAGFIVQGASEDGLRSLVRTLLLCFGIFNVGAVIFSMGWYFLK